MSSSPLWFREGWRPAGPGKCVCPVCGDHVATNAYARRQHERTHPKATASRPPASSERLRAAIRAMSDDDRR